METPTPMKTDERLYEAIWETVGKKVGYGIDCDVLTDWVIDEVNKWLENAVDVQIADTLEEIQHLDPELYGFWYSQLYPPHGDSENWNGKTLAQLNAILSDLQAK